MTVFLARGADDGVPLEDPFEMRDILEVLELYNPERLLKYRLGKNPYYPFREFTHNVFVLNASCPVFAIELVILFLFIVADVTYVSLSSAPLAMLVVPMLALVLGFPTIVRKRGKRVLVYDANARRYEYFVDGEMVYGGRCHNLYVRLMCETGGSEEAHYYSVVIDGYMMYPYKVTAVSKKREKMFRLARRMAANLDLNFFDCADRSTNHVVKHYPADQESILKQVP